MIVAKGEPEVNATVCAMVYPRLDLDEVAIGPGVPSGV